MNTQSKELSDENVCINNQIQNEIKAKSTLIAKKMKLSDDLTSLLHSTSTGSAIATKDDFGSQADVFRGEIADAVQQIQREYDNNLIEHRNQLKNKYLQTYRDLMSKQWQEVEKIKLEPGLTAESRFSEINLRQQLRGKLVDLVSDNKNMQARINELKSKISKDDNDRAVRIEAFRKDLMQRNGNLEDFRREFTDINQSNETFKAEIRRYKDLLEGSENSVGLREIAEKVEREVANELGKRSLKSSLDGNYTSQQHDGRRIHFGQGFTEYDFSSKGQTK
ncbi:hypothetical protein ACOME3_002631 [Neoechinorhynchus agilis]